MLRVLPGEFPPDKLLPGRGVFGIRVVPALRILPPMALKRGQRLGGDAEALDQDADLFEGFLRAGSFG